MDSPIIDDRFQHAVWFVLRLTLVWILAKLLVHKIHLMQVIEHSLMRPDSARTVVNSRLLDDGSSSKVATRTSSLSSIDGRPERD